MSTSATTTRTGLISDLGRTPPVVEFQHQRLRIATRLSRCRDSAGCITAIQSRPNHFQLRLDRSLSGSKTDSRLDLGSLAFPLVSGKAWILAVWLSHSFLGRS